MNKNKWYFPEFTNWYFPEFTNFESKFFDDLVDLQLKTSDLSTDFCQSNILNNNFNQDDLSTDEFLIKCAQIIDFDEKSKAEELENYKKLAVYCLIKINNLNAQLEKYKTFADLALDFVQCESKRNANNKNQIITLHRQIQQLGKHLDQ